MELGGGDLGSVDVSSIDTGGIRFGFNSRRIGWCKQGSNLIERLLLLLLLLRELLEHGGNISLQSLVLPLLRTITASSPTAPIITAPGYMLPLLLLFPLQPLFHHTS